MEQQELRAWEERCVQEEAPECTAACPLHVDARAFVGHVGAGRWKEAWQVMARTMPLTGLLGRICEAPCRARCKRGEKGGAIQLNALEQACVKHARQVYRTTLLPAKNKSVAVLGSGLAGLTVAWDLIRKGYAVTVFDSGSRPGEALMDRHPGILRPQMIADEIAVLKSWRVDFKADAEIHSPTFLQETLERFDGLFIGLENGDVPRWETDREPLFEPDTDAGLQTTRHPKIFSGGNTPYSIEQAAQGRWAATSIDRSLQKVSLTAGREKEGPYRTRLYTRLKDIEATPIVAMKDAPGGYSDEEAMAEAARCLQCQCLECVKVCPFLEKFGAYPRRYVREIYNNESMVMGARTANTMINSCSLCGLCEAVCPNDFAMQTICLNTRQSMVSNERMPPSAHEFALEDMAFSRSDAFFLARHAPEKERSSHLFFPGCQLCASSPDRVESLYAHLRDRISGGVGLMLGCCGAPAHWAGRRTGRDEVLAELQEQWKTLGRPKLILACSTCHRMFREFWPQASIQSVWETMEEIGLPEIGAAPPTEALSIHDPCTTRDVPAIQMTVRRLLNQLRVAVAELPFSKAETECCGYGGLMENANPQLAGEVIRRRAELSPRDYLTYCAMCRDSLAAVGKRSLHLLDLIFEDHRTCDPADRPRPGWSQRRENRAALKEGLLKRLWRKSPDRPAGDRQILIKIAPGLAKRLEERRILTEDLQQVIAHAEDGGPKLRHPETGRFKAAYRPRHVTFWVEYAPAEEGFEIFNAYAHRMEVQRR